jgi:tetratricopeptide (TPR) repeat protein
MAVPEPVRAFGVAAVAAALLAGAVRLQAVREATYRGAAAEEDTLYVTSGSVVRRLTGAYHALAADGYWVRAIQYYGGTKQRLTSNTLAPEPPPMIAAIDTEDYRDLYPLLDITTTLDPRFNIAYRFGAVFLAEPYPGGPGRPDLAIKLLEKGLRERPDKWEYMQDVGFVHYWYRHDYRTAAEWFDKAARVSGAPWWLKSLAATTLIQGGDRQSSRTMWEAIKQSAEVDWLRRDADRRLAQLRALDEIDILQELVDRVQSQTSVATDSWMSLVQTGRIRGVPLDPAGVPYEIGPDGRVRMAQRSALWPLPAEPEKKAPARRPS